MIIFKVLVIVIWTAVYPFMGDKAARWAKGVRQVWRGEV